jgi:hypothetical protein
VLIKLPPELIAQHRLNAFFGLVIWFISTAIFLALVTLHPERVDSPLHFLKDNALPIIIASGILMFLSFFWGCYSLAMAKGYPWATMLLGVLGPPAQIVVVVALICMQNKQNVVPMASAGKKLRPPITYTEYLQIYRKNSFVAVPLGIIGVALGVAVILVKTHMFPDRDTQTMVGMVIYAFGYAGVFAGCWYWLRAKNWSDVIMLVGMLPFSLLFIPTVHAQVLGSIGILVTGLIMLPVILIAVVFVLPDNSI